MRWFWSSIQILSRDLDNYSTIRKKFNLTGKGQGGLISLHSSSHKLLLATLAMLPFFSAVQAAEDLDSEQAFFLEMPVVLTASRLKQPLDESPSAMTVIDAEMIRASGFRKLSELFRLVPGMYVGSQNGHSSFVSYHGTTDNYARRMQVLVDGRSVYLPPFSSVTWDNIPVLLENIERIEVVRGPSAASHGANSTQGVINIITREPGILAPDQLTVAQGGNGVSDLSAMFGLNSSVMDQRLSIAYRADQGYDWSLLNDDNRTRILYRDMRAFKDFNRSKRNWRVDKPPFFRKRRVQRINVFFIRHGGKHIIRTNSLGQRQLGDDGVGSSVQCMNSRNDFRLARRFRQIRRYRFETGNSSLGRRFFD